MQLAQQQPRITVTRWQAHIWQTFNPNYRSWVKCRGQPLKPLPAPASLPPLPSEIDPAEIPDAGELQQLLHSSIRASVSANNKLSGVLEMVLSEVPKLPQSEAVSKLAACEYSAQQVGMGVITAHLDRRDGLNKCGLKGS